MVVLEVRFCPGFSYLHFPLLGPGSMCWIVLWGTFSDLALGSRVGQGKNEGLSISEAPVLCSGTGGLCFVIKMYSSAQAAVTKHHRMGSLNSRLLLRVPETVKSRIKVPTSSVPGEGSSQLVGGHLICPHTIEGDFSSFLLCPLLTKLLKPSGG